MAVDANVIIFARIKGGDSQGKTVKSAMTSASKGHFGDLWTKYHDPDAAAVLGAFGFFWYHQGLRLPWLLVINPFQFTLVIQTAEKSFYAIGLRARSSLERQRKKADSLYLQKAVFFGISLPLFWPALC